MRFPVDDIIEPLTTCELHIPDGNNASIMVAVGVVSPIDRTKTPRIHGLVIQPGYASVSVDRVLKGYSNVPLDIEGGDGGEDTRRSREDIYSMAQTLHHHS